MKQTRKNVFVKEKKKTVNNRKKMYNKIINYYNIFFFK